MDDSALIYQRFARLERLFGPLAVDRLMAAKVAVFGLGGVGSVAAESLARSAIGSLFLVDHDVVCTSNTNRQLQALNRNLDQPKAEVLGDRLLEIFPEAKIEPRCEAYSATNSNELLTPSNGGQFDYVVDCIDNLTAKAHLISACAMQKIPVVSSMGAGGKRDPEKVKSADLSETYGCPMAKQLRKLLRKYHEFPETGLFNVGAVFSNEKRNWPRVCRFNDEGYDCNCLEIGDKHICNRRKLIDGTAMFVTGVFGFHMTSYVINALVDEVADIGQLAPDRYGNSPTNE